MIRFVLCALPLFFTCSAELITVNTSRGAVQGFDKEIKDDKAQRYFGYGQVFLGIPFAKPPIGDLRFSLPEPLCQYNERGEVHNASYYRPRCWQSLDTQHPAAERSEDCLYLNVMTPNVSGSYPVMVYIHGGQFATGGADIYHWKGAVINLVSRGVAVVTIQYRVGLAGFFTTFTERFPANRGMYDQILALRWVKEEIENFGEDSNRITIFGQSAGAVAVSDLSLSPLTRGLFHQTIETSGTAIHEIETIDDVRGSIHQDRAKKICQIDSSDWGSPAKDQALLGCLLKKKPEELIAYDASDMMLWNPVIDGAFMPDYPEILGKTRPPYPSLFGDMLEEFAFFLPGIAKGDVSKMNNYSSIEVLHGAWPNYDETTAVKMTEMGVTAYTDSNPPAADDHLGWAKLTTQMITEMGYSANLIKDLQWHKSAGNDQVWLFTFAYRSLLPWNVTIDGWTPIPHSTDLPYLWFFEENFGTYNASDSDYAVANYMGELWTHFAKHVSMPYPKAGEDMNYLEINNELSTKKNWRQKAAKVFNEDIPAYLNDSLPSLPISEKSWVQLRHEGSKIDAKWNSLLQKCPRKNGSERNEHYEWKSNQFSTAIFDDNVDFSSVKMYT